MHYLIHTLKWALVLGAIVPLFWWLFTGALYLPLIPRNIIIWTTYGTLTTGTAYLDWKRKKPEQEIEYVSQKTAQEATIEASL